MKTPQRIDLTPADVDRLLERVEAKELEEGDYKIIKAMAETIVYPIKVSHESLKSGHRCPECTKGKVYEQEKPGLIVRVKGQAPLQGQFSSFKSFAAISVARPSRRLRPRMLVQKNTMSQWRA